MRQQFRHHEEPEEQLHEQRDVAEKFDIDRKPIRLASCDGSVRMTPMSDPNASAMIQAPSAVTMVTHKARQQHVEIGAGPVGDGSKKMCQFQL